MNELRGLLFISQCQKHVYELQQRKLQSVDSVCLYKIETNQPAPHWIRSLPPSRRQRGKLAVVKTVLRPKERKGTGVS